MGERHGFTITKKGPNDGPYYVVGKDVKKNILIVGQHPLRPLDTSPLLRGRKGGGILIENTNWISEIPDEKEKYTAQIRYHGELLPCQVKVTGESKAKVFFQKPILVASGQSCVVYKGNICLGGGIVI